MKSVKGILATTLFSASLMLSSVGANADDSAIIKLDKPITYEVGIHKKVKETLNKPQAGCSLW